MGGIEQNTDIPAGMEFIPSSVPDGEVTFQVSSTAPSKFPSCIYYCKWF
jgi:hypothetical protein